MHDINWLVGCLCFTSHRQRGHIEMAPPFTVPCEGREARFLLCSHLESNPRPPRGSPLHYRCATPAPLMMSIPSKVIKTAESLFIYLFGTQTIKCKSPIIKEIFYDILKNLQLISYSCTVMSSL